MAKKKPKVLNLPKDKKLPKNINVFLATFFPLGYRFYFGYMITTSNGKVCIGEVVHAIKTVAQPQYVFSVDGIISFHRAIFVHPADKKPTYIPTYWPLYPDYVVYRKLDDAKTTIIKNYLSELNDIKRKYQDYIS
jgi:hypothetical protein